MYDLEGPLKLLFGLSIIGIVSVLAWIGYGLFKFVSWVF